MNLIIIPEWFGGNIDNWYSLLETAAANVKTIDPNHPVSTGNGEVPSLDVVNSCPSVDVWGMNIYRFLNTTSAITELASVIQIKLCIFLNLELIVLITINNQKINLSKL